MNEQKKKTLNPVTIGQHRVDLERIEAKLLEYEMIKKAAVTVVKNRQGEQELCAYIVPLYFDSLHMINLVDLRGFLSSRLPQHMIPSYFVILEDLPRTAQGEVNRAVLPLPERPGREDYVPPGDEIQRKLVHIWSGVLNLEKKKIGIDADYFDLGGHSLNAIRMLGRVEKVFGVELEMDDILKVTTIRGLSKLIRDSQSNN